MLDNEFEQIGYSVVKGENDLLLVKVVSAENFRNLFADEEALFQVSARNCTVKKMDKAETYTYAILLTFGKEEKDKCYYTDVLICDLLGTFISDWY